MWGWEWYQPTTLMGRPVISANLCGGQGAFGITKGCMYKGKQQSFKRASYESTEFQMPLEE